MNILRHRLAFFLSLVFVAACGSSSKSNGGGDVVAQCKQGCTTFVSLCATQLGFDQATGQALCASACTSSGPQQGQTCTNSSAVMAAYQSCQSSTTCDAYMTCVENVPPCTGSSGSGGSSGGTGGRSGAGTGGSSGGGTGGAGGGSAGTACADLLTCCNRATNPTFMAVCNSSYTMVRDMGNDACAQALAAIQSTVCP